VQLESEILGARDKLPSEKFANIGSPCLPGRACVRCRVGPGRDLEPRKTKCWSLVPLRRRINKYFNPGIHIYVPVLLFGIRMQQLYANIDFWLGGTERNPFGNNQVCERLPNSFSQSFLYTPLCSAEKLPLRHHFFSGPIPLSIEKVQTALKCHIP
jgi:hypothetical protein